LSGTVEDRTCNRASVLKPGRLQSILARLYMPELQRSTRLTDDLAMFSGSEELEARLQKPGGQRTRTFINHIEQAVARKPHTILAYAWVMYMALFNGGRWMRTQLLTAGENFWAQCDIDDEKKDPIEQVGLGFFHFDGNMDGEDIKEDFKSRLADVERLLSVDEREDIVAEASEIFYHCRMLTEELDDMMDLSVTKGSANISLTSPALPTPQLLLKHVLPLGLVDVAADLLTLLSRT